MGKDFRERRMHSGLVVKIQLSTPMPLPRIVLPMYGNCQLTAPGRLDQLEQSFFRHHLSDPDFLIVSWLPGVRVRDWFCVAWRTLCDYTTLSLLHAQHYGNCSMRGPVASDLQFPSVVNSLRTRRSTGTTIRKGCASLAHIMANAD